MSIKVREQPWALVLFTMRDSGTELKSSGLKASVLLWYAISPAFTPYDDWGDRKGRFSVWLGLVF